MWKTIRRETGLIEHICPHGIGHPNAGSIQYMHWYFKDYYDFAPGTPLYEMPLSPYADGSHWGIHGCDGCCSGKDFPGIAANAIKFAIDGYTEEQLTKLRNEYFMLWWGLMAACAEAVTE